MTVIDYDDKNFNEKEITSAEECAAYKDTPTVTWINIDGVHDVGVVEKIGKYFGLHPLVMEDIVNTRQRPKGEDFGDYIFIAIKMLYNEGKTDVITAEQVSLILGKKYVLSFQEVEGDVFNAIRDRIRQHKGKIRGKGPDYLVYSLMDAIIDGYFTILEKTGEEVEKTEEYLTRDPQPKVLNTIHKFKRDAILLRKSVWPLREIISNLRRGGSPLIREKTLIYFNDVYDHTIQVVDTIEAFRDMASGMLDIYLSSLSNRMNEVMKVLTIFAVIFIPLTFIAGVYGMNFKYMPELDWHWGYFTVLGIMAVSALSMVIFFKKKKWF